MLSKLFTESGKGRGRPGIDKRHVAFRTQERGGNRVTMAGPKEVNGDRRIHGKKQCSATTERSIPKWAQNGRGQGKRWQGQAEWEEALAE